MFVIKFLFYFSLSFFILTIPVSENNVFFYLDEATRPLTTHLYGYLKDKATEGKDAGIKYLNKKEETKTSLVDSVKAQYSAVEKEESLEDHVDMHGGDFTKKEQKMLKDIIMKTYKK